MRRRVYAANRSAQVLRKAAKWALGMAAWSLLALPTHAHADWSAVAESTLLFTSDVFQFSAARRLSLQEDPTQPTKVEVNRPQDTVLEPALEVTRSSSNRLPTEVSARAQGFIFTEHSAFNHGMYRLKVRQALSPDTAVSVRYRYTPHLFLGPNFERRSGQRLIEEERVTSHIGRLQLEHRLTDAWTVTMIGRGGLRLFNEPFAERDTQFWTVGPEVGYKMTPRVTLGLGYLFERGLADGRDQPQFNDDVSYLNHFVSFKADLQLTAPLTLSLGYNYQRNVFTSELAADPLNGREDDTHQGTAEFQYALTEASSLTLGFQRTQRETNKGTGDFQVTNGWIGGRVRF
jgi:hypothetical protein